MRQFWTGRLARASGTYAEHAPVATACCNACRTCVTTNVVGVAVAAAAGTGYAAMRLARRLVRTNP